MIFSNAVVTVSPTYAHDIVNAGAGGFLREVFNLPHVSSFEGRGTFHAEPPAALAQQKRMQQMKNYIRQTQ